MAVEEVGSWWSVQARHQESDLMPRSLRLSYTVLGVPYLWAIKDLIPRVQQSLSVVQFRSGGDRVGLTNSGCCTASLAKGSPPSVGVASTAPGGRDSIRLESVFSVRSKVFTDLCLSAWRHRMVSQHREARFSGVRCGGMR
jgi:hypothetical protein